MESESTENREMYILDGDLFEEHVPFSLFIPIESGAARILEPLQFGRLGKFDLGSTWFPVKPLCARRFISNETTTTDDGRIAFAVMGYSVRIDSDD